MKKQGKVCLGVLLSLMMVLMVSVSVMAAEEATDMLSADFSEGNATYGSDDPIVIEEPDETKSVVDIAIDPSELTIYTKDQTPQLTVVFDPQDATDQDITWASSDSSVVTVDDDGVVTAVGDGYATITVTSIENTELKAECAVTVSLYSDGFHQDPDSDDWYYYKNGVVDTTLTDVVNGTVNGVSGWWNVVKGKVTKGETVAKNKDSNEWWYINAEGMADFSYTGFAENDNGWWYIEDGAVSFNTSSVIKDSREKIDGEISWWYVINSKVQTSFTGLADYSNDNGWWYIEDGKVTFTANTVAQNKNGWFYVEDSQVKFNYNGFGENSNGWWYIENGKVTFNKNSVIKDTEKKIDRAASWWYVVGSQVKLNYTGLADYSNENGWWYIDNGKVNFATTTVAKNKNGWWYVEDSQVKFKYNGFGENSNGWWYIENGKVTFNKNSVIKDTEKKIDGAASWWYVVGSQVKLDFTGLADYSNENGWWYINNGKVNFSYRGFAKNKNGWWYLDGSQVQFNTNSVIKGTVNGTEAWWYVVGGKVQTSFTGLADYSNENGWWYIKNGKVDFTVTTVASNKNGTWYIKDGQVAFNYSGTVTVDGVQYTVKNGKVGVSVSSTMNSKAQSQSSSTKWLIVVDTSACRLGVFTGSKGNWTPVYYWKCSPGKPSTPTKKGKFTVQSKGKSFSGKTYTCWYYTQFYGNYLIHSVLYEKGSMTKISSGTLGQQLSHGCVRLAIENAKWIYNNIPKGSTVYIY